MLPIASVSFGQALLTVLEIAVLVLWIWVGIRVIGDILESEDLSGWAKAGWILVIALLPLLGVAIYMIARGDRMTLRDVADRHA